MPCATDVHAIDEFIHWHCSGTLALDARPSMQYRLGPEKISQTRINTYSTSGRYGKSSSHARTRVAWMVWIEVVATATVMSPVSIAAHIGVRSPSVRPAPHANSTVA